MQMCIVVGLLCFAAGQASAAGKANQEGQTLSQLQRQVVEAEAQGKVFTIKLKSGKTVNGKLSWVSNEEFLVRRTRGALDRLVSPPEAEKFAYSVVMAIKQANGIMRLMRKVGEYSAATAGFTIGIPTILTLSIIDSLFGTDILPDC
jgi:hypothetical protein